MAEHFTKEKFEQQVRDSIERAKSKRRGPSPLGDPESLRGAMQRRRERRETELPQ